MQRVLTLRVLLACIDYVLHVSLTRTEMCGMLFMFLYPPLLVDTDWKGVRI